MTPDPTDPESRREFIRQSLKRFARLGSTALGSEDKPAPAAPPRPTVATPSAPEAPRPTGPIWLNSQPSMGYELLGRTHLMVSRMSLGCASLRAATADVVEQAVERGVNWLDTAINYGESEVALGAVLPAVRDKVWVCTKTPPFDAALAEAMLRAEDPARDHLIARIFEESLDSSLARLKVDHIDCYMIQSAEDPDTLRSPALADAMAKAKEQGKIVHTGVSTLRNVRAVLDAAIETSLYDVMLAPLHPLNRSWMLPILDRARFREIGIMGMMTTIALPGNASEIEFDFAELPDGMNAHQLTYLYMLKNTPYAACLTNITSSSRIEQNIYLGGFYPGIFGGNELDAIVYDRLWPYCKVCGEQRNVSDKNLESAYLARYRQYDTSSMASMHPMPPAMRPFEFIEVCQNCSD